MRLSIALYHIFISYTTLFNLAYLFCVDGAPTAAVKARQFLYAKPGFVPVYIRPGDTPLEDINVDLAEAFNVYDQKHGRIFYGRHIGDKLNDVNKKTDEIHKNSDIAIVALDEKSVENNKVSSTDNTHHIQKIPRPARR